MQTQKEMEEYFAKVLERGDSAEFKSFAGKHYSGKVMKVSENAVVIETEGGPIKIRYSSIAEIS